MNCCFPKPSLPNSKSDLCDPSASGSPDLSLSAYPKPNGARIVKLLKLEKSEGYNTTSEQSGRARIKESEICLRVRNSRDHSRLVQPDKCALIVYDMQAGIIQQIKDGAVIVGQFKQVLDAARLVGMRTFYTRHLTQWSWTN